MGDVPIDHISLQEAYGRFLDKYDTGGVRFTEEPILRAEHEAAEQPFSQHLVPYNRHATYAEWEGITHAVHDASIQNFKEVFERGELTALYEKEGKPGLYRVEMRLWNECFNMESSFYSDTFGLFVNDPIGQHLLGVRPFLNEGMFENWMVQRFGNAVPPAETEQAVVSPSDYGKSDKGITAKQARAKAAGGKRKEKSKNKMRKALTVMAEKFPIVCRDEFSSDGQAKSLERKYPEIGYSRDTIARILNGTYDPAETVIREMRADGKPLPPWKK